MSKETFIVNCTDGSKREISFHRTADCPCTAELVDETTHRSISVCWLPKITPELLQGVFADALRQF